MKKTILTIFIGMACIASSHKVIAQFDEGTNVVSFGYGLGNFTQAFVKAAVDVSGGEDFSTLGPLHFKFEHGLSEHFGIGLSANYISTGVEWQEQWETWNEDLNMYVTEEYNHKVSFKSLSLLVRGNVHYRITDMVDGYSGIGVGYRTGTWTEETNDPYSVDDSFSSSFPVGFEITSGMRFYFTDNIGAYIEVGLAKAILQGGLAIKLN